MTVTKFSWTRAVPMVLLLAGAATASGGFEQFARRQNNNNNNNDLPDLPTGVVGATTTRASSTSATPSSSTAATTTATNAAAPAQTDASASPLPSLYGVGAPALIVPDTSNAPFQQKSALPEGTVFIVVGAVLGFLGACVLAWRGLVAYSLHRSVKRAHGTYAPDSKSAFGAGNDGYSSIYGTRNVSLEMLSSQNTAYGGAGGGATYGHNAAGGKSAKPRKHSSRQPSANAASLFFSPTASNGAGAASNRTSSFLPAGYYAAGASALGGPAANGYGRVDSMESGLDDPNMRPPGNMYSRPTSSSGNLRQSQQPQQQQQQQPHQRQPSEQRRASRYRQSNSQGPSAAAAAAAAGDQGASNLSVGQAPHGRTPSAYMEDLFSEHGYGPRERF